MNRRRLELLGEARRIQNPDERLMAILRAYVLPAYSPSSDHDGGGAEFTRMRAVLSAEGNEDARSIIADAFDTTSRALLEAIAGCVGALPAKGSSGAASFCSAPSTTPSSIPRASRASRKAPSPQTTGRPPPPKTE